jgi:hypothetical protein
VSGWDIIMPVLPALVLVGLVLALVWRDRAPLWLPLVGFLALLAINVGVAVIFAPHVAGAGALMYAVGQAWCIIGCVLLLVATLAVGRRWTSRTALLLVGFAVAAPMMALFVAVGVSTLST